MFHQITPRPMSHLSRLDSLTIDVRHQLQRRSPNTTPTVAWRPIYLPFADGAIKNLKSRARWTKQGRAGWGKPFAGSSGALALSGMNNLRPYEMVQADLLHVLSSLSDVLYDGGI